MTLEEFNIIVKERIIKIQQVLQSKGKEYALNDMDRLENFKISGRIQSKSAEQALLGYFFKHLTSIITMIEIGIYDTEKVDEKIGDMINYLVLLEALMKEKIFIDSKNN